jgi:hypothetical protein
MIIALLALAGVTFESVPGHAQGAWCAYYGRGLGGTNCGFYTYRQCMEALSGNGGYCNRNPEFYAERRHYRPRYYNYYRPY